MEKLAINTLWGGFEVSTKRLNEQVKRNEERFPGDFAFQLDLAEKAEVVANCDHLRRLRFSPVLPRAFTEHGATYLKQVARIAGFDFFYGVSDSTALAPSASAGESLNTPRPSAAAGNKVPNRTRPRG